ncbi:MAG: hypothetical protein PVF08_01370 [Gammaproteobacteria bacterium]
MDGIHHSARNPAPGEPAITDGPFPGGTQGLPQDAGHVSSLS